MAVFVMGLCVYAMCLYLCINEWPMWHGCAALELIGSLDSL